MPGNDYFEAVERLFGRLQGVEQILEDAATTTVRLVTNPEKIVLKETQRAFMYFNLNKMHIDGIIMNRIFPDRIQDDYFEEWKESQKEYIEQARTYFSPVPLFQVALFRDEVLGQDRLRLLADQIYGDQNPLARFYEGSPYRISKENGQYLLTLNLPFVTKKHVELSRMSDELIVRLGGFKRHILLPRQLAATRSVKAKIEGHLLRIYFQLKGDEDGQEEEYRG